MVIEKILISHYHSMGTLFIAINNAMGAPMKLIAHTIHHLLYGLS